MINCNIIIFDIIVIIFAIANITQSKTINLLQQMIDKLHRRILELERQNCINKYKEEEVNEVKLDLEKYEKLREKAELFDKLKGGAFILTRDAYNLLGYDDQRGVRMEIHYKEYSIANIDDDFKKTLNDVNLLSNRIEELVKENNRLKNSKEKDISLFDKLVEIILSLNIWDLKRLRDDFKGYVPKEYIERYKLKK